MAKGRNKSQERVGAFREVFGGYSPMAGFTRIAQQRLRAIAEGAKVTQSEAARISAFTRRQELGIVSYDLEAAAKKRNVTVGQLGAEIRDATRGEFPKGGIRIGLPEIGHALGVDPQAVIRLSQEPAIRQRTNGRFQETRASRQIREGVLTKDGHVIAYGGDGNKYAAYTVTNKKTGQKRFFWGRFESVGYLSSAEFQDHYGDDTYDFGVEFSDFGYSWG